MVTFCKNVLDFLKIDVRLVYKNSFLLAVLYLFFIPAIRGISNLDFVRSAEVFGQSLALTGAILFIPITGNEMETGIREIICTKSWSYRKSVRFDCYVVFCLLSQSSYLLG